MSFFIETNFWARAEEMRQAVDDHFSEPETHDRRNRIWNYWYVADQYTYLRAHPNSVISEAVVDAFLEKLRSWCLARLGMGYVEMPTLSLYINGCGQALHNDATNGRFAYVYSLTRWEQRTFSGGETLLMRESDYWCSDRITQPAPHGTLFNVIPARFNQLLVFDDRMVHGVSHLQGQMSPLHGRLVLHGHIKEDGMHVEGALSQLEAKRSWDSHRPDLDRRLASLAGGYQGIVSLSIQVSPNGRVKNVRVLLDSLLPTTRGLTSPQEITEAIVTWARGLRFPKSVDDTVIVAPLAVAAG
jgi:hypothetical protein